MAFQTLDENMFNRLVSSSLSACFILTCAIALFVSPDANAKKSQLRTLVVPFEGKKSGDSTISESIELELELVESVLVKTGRSAKRDLRRAGAEGFDRQTLKAMMKKRKLDVVIRGMRDKSTKKNRDVLHVYVYAADGKPRVHFERKLPGRNIDSAAVEIVEELAPYFKRFSKLKKIKPHYKITKKAPPKQEPMVKKKPKKDAPANNDFFVDFDDDKNPDAAADDVLALDDPPKKKSTKTKTKSQASAKKVTTSSRRVAGSDDDDDDDDDDRPKRRRRALDDDDDDDDRPKKRRKRRTLDDDDDDDEEDNRRRRRRRDDDDDDEFDDDDDDDRSGRRVLNSRRDRRKRNERRLGDEEELKLAPSSQLTIEATGNLAFWSWSLQPKDNNKASELPTLYKFGGGARAEYWIKPFVGIEAEGSAARLPEVNIAGLGVTPGEVGTFGFNLGATAKARYLYAKEFQPLSFGVGLRAGYSFEQSSHELTSANGQTVTVIPGWNYHAFRVGPEVYVGYRAFERRFELQAFGDFALPLYAESPDNPGNEVVAYGWNVGASLRVPILNPVFATLKGYSRGVIADFSGAGNRRAVEVGANGEHPIFQGGAVRNMTSGLSVGVGVSF